MYNPLQLSLVSVAGKEVRWRPDPKADPYLLYLENPSLREQICTINVDGGRLLLGLDRERYLNNLEIIKPRKPVESIEIPALPVHNNGMAARFDNVVAQRYELDLPLTVLVSEAQKLARVSVGPDRPGDWVRLSPDCRLKISDGILSGLFINFNRPGISTD